MATHGFDIATILLAFQSLETELDSQSWSTSAPSQAEMLAIYQDFRPHLHGLKEVYAKVSPDWATLNQFLEETSFEPMFQPFPSNFGVGIAGGMDTFIQWRTEPVSRITINTPAGEKPGFEVPGSDIEVYELEGFNSSKLVKVHTLGDDKMWLLLPNTQSSRFATKGWGLAKTALTAMAARKTQPMMIQSNFSGGGMVSAFLFVQVPMVDFNQRIELTEVAGLSLERDLDTWNVAQAHQHIKFRMDHKSARVLTPTALAMVRTQHNEPRPLVINKPFYVWFTQGEMELPYGCMYIDYDVMRQPRRS